MITSIIMTMWPSSQTGGNIMLICVSHLELVDLNMTNPGPGTRL